MARFLKRGMDASAIKAADAQVRSVVDHLQEMKLASSVIERLAFGNYARVLKAVL